jgi:imidazole glycerol-phosphate synthase subunit HisF
MLKTRIIVSLLVDSSFHLVNTRSFTDRTYLGDPINASFIFSAFGADEILLLDIDASPQNRCIPVLLLERFVAFTFAPLNVGGGISSIEDISMILACGAEKVSLSSALEHNFNLLHHASKEFGASTISVIFNVIIDANGKHKACFGRPDLGHTLHDLDTLAFKCQEAGTGEIILNFCQREGTFSGISTNSNIINLSCKLSIPLVVLGGCKDLQDLQDSIATLKISGVAASSIFVFAPKTQQVLLSYPTMSSFHFAE